MRVAVEFDWEPVGEVGLSPSGKLAFPRVPYGPGVYCFHIEQDSVAEVYVGESEDLRQRMEHNYRYSPRPTNLRVRSMLLERLAAGKRVQLSIARNVLVELGGTQAAGDLSLKQVRLLVESAALAIARHAGEQIQNR